MPYKLENTSNAHSCNSFVSKCVTWTVLNLVSSVNIIWTVLNLVLCRSDDSQTFVFKNV